MQKIAAMGFPEAAKYTKERFGFPDTPEMLVKEWREMAREAYAFHVTLKPGVKEYLELQGHQVVMEDMMLLKGARTSKAVGGAYVGIVKHFPLLFGLGYRLGGWVSSDKRKSPVYYACSLLAGTLKGYLEQNRFDAVVTPHLYPAETLTAMKKKGG